MEQQILKLLLLYIRNKTNYVNKFEFNLNNQSANAFKFICKNNAQNLGSNSMKVIRNYCILIIEIDINDKILSENTL